VLVASSIGGLTAEMFRGSIPNASPESSSLMRRKACSSASHRRSGTITALACTSARWRASAWFACSRSSNLGIDSEGALAIGCDHLWRAPMDRHTCAMARGLGDHAKEFAQAPAMNPEIPSSPSRHPHEATDAALRRGVIDASRSEAEMEAAHRAFVSVHMARGRKCRTAPT
jgi:hypothetical protein